MQRLLTNKKLTFEQAFDQANAFDYAQRHLLACDGTFEANVFAVASRSLSKLSNETSLHSTETPVLPVTPGLASKNDKKVVLLLWIFFESFRKTGSATIQSRKFKKL